MKKALMVSCEGLGRGGVQAVMMDIVRNLRGEYNFDMLLFTDEVRYYDEEFLSYGGKILRVPFYEGGNRILRKLDYYIRGGRLYRGIYKAIQENGPYDVIHCNNVYESALLDDELENAGTDSFIERMAREILGWIKPGEEKFVQDGAAAPTPSPAP